MAERRNTSSRKRVYCPHCEEHISRSHFYQHKHLYYDENLQDWRCDRSVQHTEQDVFYEFSPSNSPIDYTSLGEGIELLIGVPKTFFCVSILCVNLNIVLLEQSLS